LSFIKSIILSKDVSLFFCLSDGGGGGAFVDAGETVKIGPILLMYTFLFFFFIIYHLNHSYC